MNPDGSAAGLVLDEFNAAFFEHELAGFDTVCVGIFIIGINDGFDAGLDKGFGAFIARKERDVESAAPEIGDTVEDGIELSVADIRVFGVEWVAFARPRHLGVGHACGHAVIADGYDFMFGIDDTGANLRVGILAAFSSEMGDTHKVFVPANVIFAHFVLLD